MIIDWKKVARSSGYISLKVAYIKEAMEAGKRKRPMRDKEELYKKFQWVICRAKHYAEHLNRPLECILYEWERKRIHGILNYYQDCRQPKFHSGLKKPIGVKGTRNFYKNHRFYGDELNIRKKIVLEAIALNQKKRSEMKRPRWSPARKKRGY